MDMKMFKGNVLSKKYLAIDIETTGLDSHAETAGILEVYAGIYTKTVLTDKFHSLYWHPNWKDTEHLHRIKESDLIGKKMFVDADNSELAALLCECCDKDSNLTLMAYYAPFEFQWLKHFMKRYNIDWSHLRVCDPRLIYKYLVPDVSHKLVDACKELIDLEPKEGDWAFHRAADDVKAMVKVYEYLINEISADDLEVYDYENYFWKLSEHVHEHEDHANDPV